MVRCYASVIPSRCPSNMLLDFTEHFQELFAIIRVLVRQMDFIFQGLFHPFAFNRLNCMVSLHPVFSDSCFVMDRLNDVLFIV